MQSPENIGDIKSLKGLYVNEFYTKKYKENMAFFDVLEKKREAITKKYVFDVTRSEEETSINIEHILKEFSVNADEFYTFGNNKLHNTRLSEKFRNPDASKDPSFLFLNGDELKAENISITHYSSLESFLDLICAYKKLGFTQKNKFEYHPYMQKYVSTLYPGVLWSSSGMNNLASDIDESYMNEIIKFFPRNIKFQADNTLIGEYPFPYRSVLKIELSPGEEMNIILAPGNTLLLSVDDYSKNVYSLCREFHLRYIQALQENYRKEVISLLDVGDFSLSKESWLRKDSAKLKEYRDFIKKRNAILLFASSGNTDEIKELFGELQSIHAISADKKQEYIGTGNARGYEGVVETDTKHLQAGRNINWCNYDINMDVSGELFINSLYKYIKESPYNISDGTCISLNENGGFDFFVQMFHSIGFDWSVLINEPYKILMLAAELNQIFGCDFSSRIFDIFVSCIPDKSKISYDKEKVFSFILTSASDEKSSVIIRKMLSYSQLQDILSESFFSFLHTQKARDFYHTIKANQNTYGETYFPNLLPKNPQLDTIKDFQSPPFCLLGIDVPKLDTYDLLALSQEIETFFAPIYVNIFYKLIIQSSTKSNKEKVIESLLSCGIDEEFILSLSDEMIFEFLLVSHLNIKIQQVFISLLQGEGSKRMKNVFQNHVQDTRFPLFFKEILRFGNDPSKSFHSLSKMIKDDLIKPYVAYNVKNVPKSLSDAPFHLLGLEYDTLHKHDFEKLFHEVQEYFGEQYAACFMELIQDFYSTMEKERLLHILLETGTNQQMEKNFFYLKERGFYDRFLSLFKEFSEHKKLVSVREAIFKKQKKESFLFTLFWDAEDDKSACFFRYNMLSYENITLKEILSLKSSDIFEFLLESLMNKKIQEIFETASDEEKGAMRYVLNMHLKDKRFPAFYKQIIAIIQEGYSWHMEEEKKYAGGLKNMIKEVFEIPENLGDVCEKAEDPLGTLALILEKILATKKREKMIAQPQSLNDIPFCFLGIEVEKLQDLDVSDLSSKIQDSFGREYVTYFDTFVKDYYENLDDNELLELLLKIEQESRIEYNFLYLKQIGFYERVLRIFKENIDDERLKEIYKKGEINPYHSKFFYYIVRDMRYDRKKQKI